MNAALDQLLDLLATSGVRQYGEEPVSQCEHALQCAFLAEREGASAALIAAALLHDIGHLLQDAGERPALRDIDDKHEEVAAEHLRRIFGPSVAEPVRLHVVAKRYLCAVDPGYLGRLSPASMHSLQLQGGAFSPAVAVDFRALPGAEAAIRLRLWDDAAKLPGCETPLIEHYRTTLAAALVATSASPQ